MSWFALWLACSTPAPPAAPTTPPDPCVSAWRDVAALSAAVPTHGLAAPAESRFLAACRALPAALQPCASPRHAAAEPAACEAAAAALSRHERRALTAGFQAQPLGAP